MIGSIALAVTGHRHRIARLETRNISAANWFTLEAIQALSASGAPTGAFQGRVTRWTRMSRGEYDEISVRTGRRRLKSLLAERGEEAA